jgi:hypothetical protein
MEAAAAAAARDAALAASDSVVAAAKGAAVAAATAKEATDAAKEAAATASAAALSAKEAAVTAAAAALSAKEAAATASAAALDAKQAAAVAAAAMQAFKKRKFANVTLNIEEAAPVAVAAGEASVAAAAVAAAALQASKKSKFSLIGDDQDPTASENADDGGSIDFISGLPDAVLGSIVSLLPTKEAARTQVISRRWRPLWRSTPLNLVADQGLNSKDYTFVDLISKILSAHPGPVCRFSLCRSISNCYGNSIKGWLSSPAMDKLQEFELIPSQWFYAMDNFYLLPSSVYRFAPTLRVAKFGSCRFTNLIVKLSLKFPCLKQLTLDRVAISEEVLQSMLSGCYALESLELNKNSGFGRLCINSQTLKSIGFCTNWMKESVPLRELVIEDAPCLERLLSLDPRVSPATIRVISAPKLNILGVFSEDMAQLQFGTTVCQVATAFIRHSFSIPVCKLLFLFALGLYFCRK